MNLRHILRSLSLTMKARQVKTQLICRKYRAAYFGTLTRQCSTHPHYPIPELVELDYNYICDISNINDIKNNISKRNSNADIEKVISLWNTLKSCEISDEERTKLERKLQHEALKIPNRSSSHLLKYGDNPYILKMCNEKPVFKFKPKEFHAMMQYGNLLMMERHLSYMTGSRSYILCGALAELEKALIKYTISILLKKGFILVSVPDLLYSHIIERCGMQTKGKRAEVYHLSELVEGKEVCLSGTAEMGLGGALHDEIYDAYELPLKMVAVSRCYRDEIGKSAVDKGLFRVHEFNKVEMFGVTPNETGEESQQLYEELVETQIEIFSALGFHFQVLDMPLNDLGNPAYTKTDIEAWIPVKNLFSEISSASNCLDYQSRRLNLKYRTQAGELKFPHTLNGTACATPRVLMAMIASNQTAKHTITIPEVLRPFMSGAQEIIAPTDPPVIRYFDKSTYIGEIIDAEMEVN